MITAQEARELVEQSDSAFTHVLTIIDKEIREKAKEGVREYCLYETGWWESMSYGAAIKAVASAKQSKLMNELSKHGFNPSFGKISDSYVPRALSDDAGQGPEYVNIGIKVRW